MKIAFVAISLLLAQASLASTNNSSVVDLQIRSSPTVSGSTRVSVQIIGATTCAVTGWYAFEFAANSSDSGVGKIYIAAFIAAQQSGRHVIIHGTGVCDTQSVETISYIDTL